MNKEKKKILNRVLINLYRSKHLFFVFRFFVFFFVSFAEHSCWFSLDFSLSELAVFSDSLPRVFAWSGSGQQA